MCPFSRHLFAFFGTTALVGSALFVVTEFGAMAEDSARLQYLSSEDEKWETELELTRGRETTTRDIGAALCDNRLTLTEAIDAVMALAEDSPDWIEQLRGRYCSYGFLLPTATDREVMTRYLRVHIEAMKSVAESAGESTRVVAFSAHLAHLGDGHDSVPAPRAHK